MARRSRSDQPRDDLLVILFEIEVSGATMLADLLRVGSLPESWIRANSIRELRELVRYRNTLSRLRTGLKGQVHAVLGKEGVIPALREMWGPSGFEYLNGVHLAEAYEIRLESLRDLIEVLDKEIRSLEAFTHQVERRPRVSDYPTPQRCRSGPCRHLLRRDR